MRYRSAAVIWSGNPNPHLITQVADLARGTAVDVGSGEGAQTIWLARSGRSLVSTCRWWRWSEPLPSPPTPVGTSRSALRGSKWTRCPGIQLRGSSTSSGAAARLLTSPHLAWNRVTR